jgi:hypothetical protein
MASSLQLSLVCFYVVDDDDVDDDDDDDDDCRTALLLQGARSTVPTRVSG